MCIFYCYNYTIILILLLYYLFTFLYFVSYSGHADILKRLEEGLQGQAGLYLGGNYRTGVAIGDCVQYGVDVAAQVEKYLRNY